MFLYLHDGFYMFRQNSAILREDGTVLLVNPSILNNALCKNQNRDASTKVDHQYVTTKLKLPKTNAAYGLTL
jgi:hypothetical protein